MAIALNGQARTLKGKKVGTLRRQGIVPAEIYGKGEENVSAQFNEIELAKTIREAGTTSLIDVTVGSKKMNVLVKSVIRSLDRKSIVHVDFYSVNPNLPVKAIVPVKVTGESPLIAQGGVLVSGTDKVEVSCLPKDIPKFLTVDSSVLVEFSGILSVANLIVPAGVTVTSSPTTMLAYISHTRATRSAAAAEDGAEAEKK